MASLLANIRLGSKGLEGTNGYFDYDKKFYCVDDKLPQYDECDFYSFQTVLKDFKVESVSRPPNC